MSVKLWVALVPLIPMLPKLLLAGANANNAVALPVPESARVFVEGVVPYDTVSVSLFAPEPVGMKFTVTEQFAPPTTVTVEPLVPHVLEESENCVPVVSATKTLVAVSVPELLIV